jgi:hypothetical protein
MSLGEDEAGGDVQDCGDGVAIGLPATEKDTLGVFEHDDFHLAGMPAILALPERHHLGGRERAVVVHGQHVEEMRFFQTTDELRDEARFPRARRTLENRESADLLRGACGE